MPVVAAAADGCLAGGDIHAPDGHLVIDSGKHFVEHAGSGEMAPAGSLKPRLQPLDPGIIHAWRIATTGRFAVVAVFAFAIGVSPWFPVHPLVVPLTVLVLGSAVAVLWPPARYRAWGYLVREDDLLVRQGVLWRRVTVVPHARIQHADTRRNLLDRWLGLASVVVFTAGIHGAAVEIPGLRVEDGEELRDRLVRLSGRSDAV